MRESQKHGMPLVDCRAWLWSELRGKTLSWWHKLHVFCLMPLWNYRADVLTRLDWYEQRVKSLEAELELARKGRP